MGYRILEIWDSATQKFIYYAQVEKTIVIKKWFKLKLFTYWECLGRYSKEQFAKDKIKEIDSSVNPPTVWGGAINIWG